ncbi:MAG TPA: metallophosphoesterase, partial [Spirochaetia bacterium]|nr:metallophosphoesterase [Spirochaetia bacterium]
VGFPQSRIPNEGLFDLQGAWGPRGEAVISGIKKAGQITFQAIGDSGAASARTFPSEIRVADEITRELHTAADPDRPAFLYHLGDLVYNFGESAYYYDQFYEAFRDFPAPILAIPGNHDSFVLPNTPQGQTPLDVFMRNFCAASPVVTREAGSLHRTAMTQPGVYFTLDAPFVRIIGLFSNALEDPGVISHKDPRWSVVPNYQLDFLTAQLRKIRTESFKGAVLIAVHHPPFSYAPQGDGAGGKHFGSWSMLEEIDAVCAAEGVYPHAFLSGHAHNYQRYTRSLVFGGSTISVPFVVCGDGGHNVNGLVSARNGTQASEPADGADVSYLDSSTVVTRKGLVLDRHDQSNFGYLRVVASAKELTISFVPVTPKNTGGDAVTVDLGTHTVRSPSKGPAKPGIRAPAKASFRAPARRGTKSPARTPSKGKKKPRR